MMSDLLSEALARRSLTLFVGADLPQSVTGMPSRAELAAGLARRHGLDDTLPLAEVAQRVSQANNRWEFTEFICNALDLSGQLPQIFQQSIVSLDVRFISSLPVMQQPAYKVWADKRPVQIVWAVR